MSLLSAQIDNKGPFFHLETLCFSLSFVDLVRAELRGTHSLQYRAKMNFEPNYCIHVIVYLHKAHTDFEKIEQQVAGSTATIAVALDWLFGDIIYW